jgi:cell division protein FtsI (penicillin-binding protein 3)
MNSNTGKLIYISNINSATKFEYEPSSVMQPIAISLALNNSKVSKNELINIGNGSIKIDKWTIKDSHKYTTSKISIKDILAYSSNVGTILIANRLSGQEFYNGYKSFGFTNSTGLNIKDESIGKIQNLEQYKYNDNTSKLNIFKSTSSYGYGIKATHMQLLKAYNVFNNNGKLVNPYLDNISNNKQIQVLNSDTANTMKVMLINVVQNGNAKRTIIKGIEIGGKTGTANIIKNGKYSNKYISSFFGFANYKDSKYTIGVTVVEPVSTGKDWYLYYASNSAVLVFKDVVEELIKDRTE